MHVYRNVKCWYNVNVFWCIVILALLVLFTMYQPYNPHHFPRPPTLPPKPQRMRKSRPRSIFNRKLFNGNMEAFIQVLAHLCSLSLHELSCLASNPWEFSCLCPLFYPNVGSLMHWLSSCSLPCLHTVLHSEKTGWSEKAMKQILELDWFL